MSQLDLITYTFFFAVLPQTAASCRGSGGFDRGPVLMAPRRGTSDWSKLLQITVNGDATFKNTVKLTF